MKGKNIKISKQSAQPATQAKTKLLITLDSNILIILFLMFLEMKK